jgi:hypothetical protein
MGRIERVWSAAPGPLRQGRGDVAIPLPAPPPPTSGGRLGLADLKRAAQARPRRRCGLKRAIRLRIALMVLCCDPLAIALTAAASARRSTARVPSIASGLTPSSGTAPKTPTGRSMLLPSRSTGARGTADQGAVVRTLQSTSDGFSSPLRFESFPRGSSAFAAGHVKRHIRPEGA